MASAYEEMKGQTTAVERAMAYGSPRETNRPVSSCKQGNQGICGPSFKTRCRKEESLGPGLTATETFPRQLFETLH